MQAQNLTCLNTASIVVRQALRESVFDYEERSLEAARRGDFLSAQTYKQWAFATDLAVHKAASAISALFIDALESSSEEPIRAVAASRSSLAQGG